MLPDFVAVHRRASTALDALLQREHDCLAAKFTALRDLPATEWAKEGVREQNGSVRRVPVTGDLFALFSVLPDHRFLIQDFVRQETLDRFFTASAAPVPQT
jgi:hypothetical protein